MTITEKLLAHRLAATAACVRCGAPAAYPGALYCGAACSAARHDVPAFFPEGHCHAIDETGRECRLPALHDGSHAFA